jgi:phytoene synthase
MCLKVFVNGNEEIYNELKDSAMRLGSAFQKVNFLRDLKADFEELSRTYFPNTDLNHLDEKSKKKLLLILKADFKAGFEGILLLPLEAKLGVYTAYVYYKKLLSKLSKTPSAEIKNTRVRVPDYQKYGLFAKCYFNYKLKFI